MAKGMKKSYALWIVCIVTVLLAAATVGCYFGGQYLAQQQATALERAQQEVQAANDELKTQYMLELAEYHQKLAAREGAANEAWPVPSGNGWEIVDLTNYPLENPQSVGMTRQETMYNGMLLVNEWHSRPDDFGEGLLVSVTNHSGHKIGVKNSSIRLFPDAADALMALVAAAKEQGYENYVCYDAYRSYEEQNTLFQAALNKYQERYSGDALINQAKKEVNYPGTSSYNGGQTFRIILYKAGDKEVNDKVFFDSPEGLWFYDHCWEYGIVFRFQLADYPVKGCADKGYKTGVSSQLQTFSYVGKGNAAVMHALDLCMEEYVEYLMAHPHIAVFENGVLRYEINRQYVGEADTFPITVIGNGTVSSYTTSLDNMGYAITVFEY